MGHSRPLFVYFRSFLVTISIQIEKSIDGVLGPQDGRRRRNHGAMAATVDDSLIHDAKHLRQHQNCSTHSTNLKFHLLFHCQDSPGILAYFEAFDKPLRLWIKYHSTKVVRVFCTHGTILFKPLIQIWQHFPIFGELKLPLNSPVCKLLFFFLESAFSFSKRT